MKNILFIIFLPFFALSKIQVAATTTDVAAIVRAVAGEHVDVFAIAKGTQDPHQIEAKPSFMVKLRSADLIVAQGLELETAWLTPLIEGARNERLFQKNNVLELGPSLDPIEVPKGNISRADGDVHPGGNPHFQLDPIRVGKAAIIIADRLGQLSPELNLTFSENAKKLNQHLMEKTSEWKKRVANTGIKQVVTYHKYLAYFCSRFEITCELQLEPKPGIPPTATHLLSVISEIKKRSISLVLIENLYLEDAAKKLKQDIPNLKIQKIPVSVEGEPAILNNEQLIEKIVSTLEASK